MNILLLGAQGQVGQELLQCLPQTLLQTLPQATLTALARPQLDLSQPETLRELIQQARPDVLINAAAYTAVDRAESEPDLAHAINAQAPQVMAEECDRLGASLFHISTDYVFDGQGSQPYCPEDPTQPLGVYGRSKLAGEQAILQACDQAWIVRTAWVYGVYGQGNFVKTMLRLGADRPVLKVVADQIGSPTWAADLARAIAMMTSHRAEIPPGLYHYSNSGICSWYDFALAIFEEAKAIGWPLMVHDIQPITTADYPTPAQRPAYSVLSTQKLVPWVGIPPHWRSSLRLMLQNLQNHHL
jgi:dTDP-4-dehydrorhamnose reductase